MPQEIYQEKSMENIKFESLTVSLGERYLYYHNNGCEHIIIIKDIRSYNKNCDKPFIEDYPSLKFLVLILIILE